ncbi:MAG: SulP family inorganic anion transporter, partial [Opitutae bacterium]|nr:SulP family inorganic anion transporter [Opitutae bacterium]
MKKLRISARLRAQLGHLSLFPIRKVVAEYTLKDALADAKASINVALLTFPMGMAFALMAGLPIQTGLVGCAVAALIGPLFSGTSFLAFGPSNATAVMLLSALTTAGAATVEARLALLPTIVFLVGIFLILAAITRV